MTDLPSLLVGLALANQFALPRRLPSPPAGSMASLRDAVALTLATAFTALLAWLLTAWLPGPGGLPELGLVAIALAATASTPVALRAAHLLTPTFPGAVSTPVAAGINAGVLAAALLVGGQLGTPLGALAWGSGSGAGLAVVMLLLAGARERLDSGEVPPLLRGPAIALVTAGFLSLALGALAGIVRS